MVETLACPSCGKPVALSLLRAGYTHCHHCGGALPKAAGQPASPGLRRLTSADSGVTGSSPQWQEPQPRELRRRPEHDSDIREPVAPEPVNPVGSDPVNPVGSDPVNPAPAVPEDRPVNLADFAVGPKRPVRPSGLMRPVGDAAPNTGSSPRAGSAPKTGTTTGAAPKTGSAPKMPGAKSGTPSGSGTAIPVGSSPNVAVSPEPVAPQAVVPAPQPRPVRTVVRRRSGSGGWLVPLSVFVGFALTLAAVVYVLLTLNR